MLPDHAERDAAGVGRAIYAYDGAFQNMAAVASAYAARRIVAIMRTIMQVRSVVDIGCARATWLREWQAQCVKDVTGVDGAYVDCTRLEIEPCRFVATDLSHPFSLGRTFDLAQCLEVAEHLRPERAKSFVADLVALAPAVLFSAATPGQGGENHLNERPGRYWQSLFRAHGYVAVDCLRPILARDKKIPIWYRLNLVLYVHEDRLDLLTPSIRFFKVGANEVVADLAPPLYRVRQLAISLLPISICNRLARWNARRYPPAQHSPDGALSDGSGA